MTRFQAVLEPAPRGGLYVVVPPSAAEKVRVELTLERDDQPLPADRTRRSRRRARRASGRSSPA